MACSNLACIGSGGCVESLTNGESGQVLAIDPATNQPAWIDQADSHDPVTLGAGSDPALTLSGQVLTLTLPATHDPASVASGSNPALTVDPLTQVFSLDLSAQDSYAGPTGTPLQGIDNVTEALNTIAPCLVCSIDSTDDCSGGIGGTAPNRYAIRSASVANGVLTLNGAPEHDTRSFQSGRDNVVVAQGPFATLTTPNNGVPDFYDLEFETIDIVNLSECRNARVFFSVTSWWFGTGMTVDTDLSLAMLIRNGPLNTSPVVALGVEKNSGGTNEDVLGTCMTCTYAVLIPPLGTQQITLQYQLQMFNGTLNQMNVVQRHYTWMYSTQDG